MKQRKARISGLNGGGYPDNNPKTVLGIVKPSLSKVPASALIYMALGFMDGARKYGAFNWRSKKVTASIYIDACKRHLDMWFDGEELASDSKFPHLAHALACIAIIVDAKENGSLVDDRPTPGSAARLIEQWTVTLKAMAVAREAAELKAARALKRKGKKKQKGKRK